MTVVVVAGIDPAAGATTVAVGLAHRLAYAGHSVRLERLAGDERAESDAAVFATLEFADASGEPVLAAALTPGGDGVTLVEAPAGADAAAVASGLDALLLLVGAPGSEVAGGAMLIANRARRAGPRQIPEDRLLAAPTAGRLIEASRARVLARSAEGDAALCEHIVIGPIFHDAGEPHFKRMPRQAVVTRAEKVDVALAALRADVRCLILTGGNDPSPYVLDYVASSRTTTLLVVAGGTVETVRDIEGAFGSSPFSGEEKVERIGELMADALDDAALATLLGGS